MNIYAIFEHFCQNNKYNESGWFLLMSLDKVRKENNEVRDLIIQLKQHMNNLEASMFTLKEALISCTCWARAITKLRNSSWKWLNST